MKQFKKKMKENEEKTFLRKVITSERKRKSFVFNKTFDKTQIDNKYALLSVFAFIKMSHNKEWKWRTCFRN